MAGFFRFLISIPFLGWIIYMALANDAGVAFRFSPLHDPAEMTLSAALLIAVGVGFLWAGLMMMTHLAAARAEAAKQRRRNARLEKEIAQEKQAAPPYRLTGPS